MANQTIRTPEKETVLLSALRERPSYAAACRKAGISRAAFYDWLQDEDEFAGRVTKARGVGLDALEDALVTRGLKNDTTAAIFMLKSHRKEIYGDKIAVKHSGTIAHRDMSAFSDDEIDSLAAIAERVKQGVS